MKSLGFMRFPYRAPEGVARALVREGPGEALDVIDGACPDHSPDHGPRALALLTGRVQLSHGPAGDAPLLEGRRRPVAGVAVLALEEPRQGLLPSRPHVRQGPA